MKTSVQRNEILKRNFIDYLSYADGKAEQTIRQMEKDILHFEAFMGFSDFKTFYQLLARRFKEDLSEQNLDKATILSTVTALKRCIVTALKRCDELEAFGYDWQKVQSGYKRKIRQTDVDFLRLLVLAEIHHGGSPGDAACIGSAGLQTVRDWVLRYDAHGPDGLVNGGASGKPPKLNDAQRRELAQVIDSGPTPAIHGVDHWRLIDLTQWVWDEFGIRISTQTLSRELSAMGYAKLPERPGFTPKTNT